MGPDLHRDDEVKAAHPAPGTVTSPSPLCRESTQDSSRARLAQLLTARPARIESVQTIENRRIWSRATEQERRRMLKDCGWL
jgi:hypothetical protein